MDLFSIACMHEYSVVASYVESMHNHTKTMLQFTATERTISFKNLLQEYLQKSHISELPLYDTERTEDGFVCTVVVKLSPDKAQHFKGAAHGNKKSAEQESAKVACYELKVVT